MHIGRLNQLHDFTQEAVEGLFGSERDRSISEHSQTNFRDQALDKSFNLKTAVRLPFGCCSGGHRRCE